MISVENRPEILFRRFSRLIAASGLLIGGLWCFEQVIQQTRNAWWWEVGHAVLFIALGTIIFATKKCSLSALRKLLVTTVILGFTLQVLTFPAYLGPIPAEVWEYSWNFTGVYLCLLILVIEFKRPYLSMALVAMCTALLPIFSLLLATGEIHTHILIVALVQYTNVAYPLLLIALRSRMHLYGEAQDRWKLRAVEFAAARERLLEERRLGRAVHDEILGVMNQAIWSDGKVDDELRQSALNALKVLEEGEGAENDEMDIEEVQSIVRSILKNQISSYSYTIEAGAGSIPTTPAVTLLSAFRETLRNSLKHAPHARREVSVFVANDKFEIYIADDGPGFAISNVKEDRLGLFGSVFGRMDELSGGTVKLTSSAGAGTEVRLTWVQE